MRTTPQTLTPKDETTLTSLGTYTFMNANQVQQLVYPLSSSYRTATKRLTQLSATYDENTNTFLDDGYLSYGLVHEKTGAIIGRPKRYFFLTPKNTTYIKNAYKRRGKLDCFNEHFADANIIKSNGGYGYARSHILHELKVTDYGLAFNKPSIYATPLLWERTSPKSEAITRSYQVNKHDPFLDTLTPQTVRFNPDCIDLSLDPAETNESPTLYFSVVEIDRATEGTAELTQKIYGFDELIQHRHVALVRDYFIKRYGLARTHPFITNPEQYRFNFRVRFVTTTPRRRNEIIHLIAHRSENPSIYHVTTFDKLEEWDTFYTSPHWYVASHYNEIKKREERETKGMRAHAVNDWLAEQIEARMKTVPYFYSMRRAEGDYAEYLQNPVVDTVTRNLTLFR